MLSDQREMWERSRSPSPPWSQQDANRNWTGIIVGQEIDPMGTSSYEVRWEHWRKPRDVVNTTWTREEEDVEKLLPEWNKVVADRALHLASESRDISLATLSLLPPHMKLTAERAEARTEKQERARREPDLYADWDKDVIRIRDNDSSDDKDEPLLTRRGRARPALSSSQRQSTASSSRGGTSGSTSRASSPCTTTIPTESAVGDTSEDDIVELPAPKAHVSAPKAKAQSKTRTPQVSARPTASLSNAEFALRQRLEDEFNKAATEHGAASVRIVNDVDGEEIPVLPKGFKWIETGYVYLGDVQRQPPEFLAGCDCSGPCGRDIPCSCQNQAHLPESQDKGGLLVKQAYTSKGLLHAKLTDYPHQFYVNECNENCSCKASPNRCRNRIVQLPRDVPVEIFKTDNGRGWGLRTAVDLSKGKILGTYTGELTPRDDVVKRKVKYNYMFDLDFAENLHNKPGAWSVNALRAGNWSRFLNHSCEPNMRAFHANYDSIHDGADPKDMRPHIAFAAKTNIPAFTELTIDYEPELPDADEDEDFVMIDAEEATTKKTTLRCMCGSARCRREFSMEY